VLNGSGGEHPHDDGDDRADHDEPVKQGPEARLASSENSAGGAVFFLPAIFRSETGAHIVGRFVIVVSDCVAALVPARTRLFAGLLIVSEFGSGATRAVSRSSAPATLRRQIGRGGLVSLRGWRRRRGRGAGPGAGGGGASDGRAVGPAG